jgi:hypothetical protein
MGCTIMAKYGLFVKLYDIKKKVGQWITICLSENNIYLSLILSSGPLYITLHNNQLRQINKIPIRGHRQFKSEKESV